MPEFGVGPSIARRARAVLCGREAECASLDRLLGEAREGQSAVLVLRGEPGIGKSALLAYAAERGDGCRVLRAVGVEWEMELPFAAVHQLCAGLLERRGRLPAPQGEALATAFGLSRGPAPDRFLVGLAVLGLMSDAAEARPLVCVVDDVQWLDRSSAQALAFVARRLVAESVVLLFAEREPSRVQELAGMPELRVGGLADASVRQLLASVVTAPLDARVRERILAEREAIRLRCSSCRASFPPTDWPGVLVHRATDRCQAGSRRASGGARGSCRARPSGCCCWQRPTRRGSRRSSFARQRRSTLRWTTCLPPRLTGCWS
jgi:hypothetical protein